METPYTATSCLTNGSGRVFTGALCAPALLFITVEYPLTGTWLLSPPVSERQGMVSFACQTLSWPRPSAGYESTSPALLPA